MQPRRSLHAASRSRSAASRADSSAPPALMRIALAFPGQGSQHVGMGKQLHESYGVARAVFEEVDDALQSFLSRLMFDGDESELTETSNAQPALLAHSVAALRVLEDEFGVDLSLTHDAGGGGKTTLGGGPVAAVMGHSVGEYAALVAAGVLRVADAAVLLRARGDAMRDAVPLSTKTAMAALMPTSERQALEAIDGVRAANGVKSADDVVEVANVNSPKQVVISGGARAVEAAGEAAKENKWARRVTMLKVSAPFHCSLMKPAADALEAALAQVELADGAVPLVSNVTATLVAEAEEIRRLMVEQVTAPVRWSDCVSAATRHGVTHYVELGPGKVLSGLIRQCNASAVCSAVAAPADLAAVRAVLNAA